MNTKLKLTRGGFAWGDTSCNYHTGTWRVQRPQHEYRAAPCHASCPAGEDPQAYIALLDSGKPQQAWEELVSINPLPAITGRVCPHPCETGCNRGDYDQPLAIHSIERYLGDLAIEHDWAYPVTAPPADAPHIAVLGAGPAGLSAAWHCLRNGLQVTVFDEEAEAGGTLFTIPNYRLPDDVVRAETRRLLKAGINFTADFKLGREMNLDELQRRYAAVFLAPGVMKSSEWSIDGVTPRDLHQGLHLLKEWGDVGALPPMKTAVVIGGGNTAIDIARLLVRNGVDTHIIIHSSMPDPAHPLADDMRAMPREINQALEEGVKILNHHGIKRLLLRGEKVTGIEIIRMRKLPDDNGKLHRIAFDGTESILHVDQVIPAIGQIVDQQGMEDLVHGEHHIKVDAWGQVAGSKNVFAGGDAIDGNGGTVTEAVGNGRMTAQAIAMKLKQQGLPVIEPPVVVHYENLNTEYFEPAPRAEQAVLPVAERVGETEIEAGLSVQQVEKETRRCFSCGSCLSCDNCWTLCPDNAVLKSKKMAADGSYYVFDYDYCKGCGLCAMECPTGYILMVEDI